MKLWKKLRWVAISTLAFAMLLPTAVSADAVVGETIVTLGKDLTPQQRQQILNEMGFASENDVDKIVEVTNEEEHQYLGKYMPAATIGTRALSSAKIVISEKNKGVSIKTTDKISSITNAMYANAVITAGVKDVDIFITAPFKVSGTAALTGIIKAFEQATGTKISEEQKQVANQELVQTQTISEQIKDPNKAAQFMNKLKEEIAQEKPETPADYRDIIINISNDMDITLNQTTINQLVTFSEGFSSLNIDVDQLTDQISKLSGDLQSILNSEEAEGFIDTILEWLGDIFNAIGGFFKALIPGSRLV
ncbi:DUF1002 domain-containing protein [Risungbinella massiliensis]|uniref:DUF1002 domain-containing protein n=1 Tax=Risungbinella massiliensis TaxID=1329796 RepID=UPI00069B8884|nr:DUF1002 domain-containing protein [Risungbinella massiliensis]